MVRIKWISKITGYTGYGNWFDFKEEPLLMAWVNYGNKEYPEVHHFLQYF